MNSNNPILNSPYEEPKYRYAYDAVLSTKNMTYNKDGGISAKTDAGNYQISFDAQEPASGKNQNKTIKLTLMN